MTTHHDYDADRTEQDEMLSEQEDQQEMQSALLLWRKLREIVPGPPMAITLVKANAILNVVQDSLFPRDKR